MRSPESAPAPKAPEADTNPETARKVNQARGKKVETGLAYADALLEFQQNQLHLQQINQRLAELDAEEKAKLATEEAAKAVAETYPPFRETVAEPAEPGAEDEEAQESHDEKVEKTVNKAKKSPTFKAIAARALGLALAALVVVNLAGSTQRNSGGNEGEGEDSDSTEDTVSTPGQGQDQEANFEILTGIQDGYNKDGMWLDAKGYRFADASRLGEIYDLDEVEMVKAVGENEVEALADYIANFPDALKPEGFKGLNLKETEAKIESLSSSDYDALLQYFKDTMDSAYTRRVTINGRYSNAFMGVKNPDGSGTYLTAEQFKAQYPDAELTHDMMELVKCTTNETNLEVTDFFWVDQNNQIIGHMMAKITPVYDKGGSIVGYTGCIQIVLPDGTVVHLDLPEVPPPADEDEDRGGPETTTVTTDEDDDEEEDDERPPETTTVTDESGDDDDNDDDRPPETTHVTRDDDDGDDKPDDKPGKPDHHDDDHHDDDDKSDEKPGDKPGIDPGQNLDAKDRDRMAEVGEKNDQSGGIAAVEGQDEVADEEHRIDEPTAGYNYVGTTVDTGTDAGANDGGFTSTADGLIVDEDGFLTGTTVNETAAAEGEEAPEVVEISYDLSVPVQSEEAAAEQEAKAKEQNDANENARREQTREEQQGGLQSALDDFNSRYGNQNQ